MPWRGSSFSGEYPTLGWLIGLWIEANCVVPDGDLTGTPYKLTDEMWSFLAAHYRLRPDASAERPASAWQYRRSQLVRPQKWGKGPFAAALVCAEAAGPAVFAGWDADGEPVGRPWPTPWIQCTAVSEAQVANVYKALLPMVELGILRGAIPDTGETRINLPNGGRIEPTTASARSRLGARVTFCVNDETHSWLKSNGGYALADTQRRNLAGTGGRLIETTNAWDPAEESVAQVTDEYVGDDVYRDRTTAPINLSFGNRRERRRILRTVYADSFWVDIDRIDAECEELIARGEAAQAERFFGNRIVATADVWINPPEAWDACADTSAKLEVGDEITLGFDGSRFDDATALVACRVSDGLLVPLGIWSKPDGPAGSGWEVDYNEVDAKVAEAFDRYTVLYFYADPPYWQESIGNWAQEHGVEIVREWWTNRDRAMIAALERFATAVHTGELKHTGDAVLTTHIRNARRKVTRTGVQIRKDRPGSSRKIDAAVAAVVAFEARGDAIASGRTWIRKQRRIAKRSRSGIAD